MGRRDHSACRWSGSRVSITATVRIAVTVLTVGIAAPPVGAQYAYPGTGAPEVRVPRSVLERYVGEWVYPTGNTVMLRLRGDTLFREIPGQQVPLVPISETLFRLGPVFTAEFVTDEAGGMTQVLSDGAAVEYRLHKKGTAPAALPPTPTAVRVPTSVLQRYVGEYEYVPGQMSRTDLRVFVRLRGDTLVGAAGPVLVLTPLSETRFQLGGTSIDWEFAIDQEGGVTLSMGSGSQQMKARRTKP